MAKSVFMLGKGGTGKTTLATLLGIHMAYSGFKVLLVSLDPAHNLSDILDANIKSKPTSVMNGLRVMEVDLDGAVKKYLKDTAQAVQRNYQYLTALNLEKYFDLYQHTPGLDAHGLLSVYQNLLRDHRDLDFFIFDMPPTALSLQFFRLPGLSVEWLHRLLELRNEILEKQKIITRIKIGKYTIEQDKPLEQIRNRLQEYRDLIKNLQNSRFNAYSLICNPDPLSFNEAADIANNFTAWGMPITNLIVNKSEGKPGADEVRPQEFRDLAAIYIKHAGRPITGMAGLNQFLSENKGGIAELFAGINS